MTWIQAFAAAGHGSPLAQEPLADGTISTTRRLRAADGFTAVLKERVGAPPDLFAVEAESLAILATVPGWRVPAVLGRGLDWLLLEDLGPQVDANTLPFPESSPQWEVFARALAHCHGRRYSRFGWHCDTYWGLVRFDNQWRDDGFAFYRDTRFRFLLTLPGLRHWLQPAEVDGVERIADRLEHLVPIEAPCLNHGDLWAGNRMRCAVGPGQSSPAVIDPFIHAGHAACDRHNLLMYGGFPERFWDAYRESRWLPREWRRHAEVFNVLHCLGCLAHDTEIPWHLRELRRLIQVYG